MLISHSSATQIKFFTQHLPKIKKKYHEVQQKSMNSNSGRDLKCLSKLLLVSGETVGKSNL